jgi:hypothetical protein
MPFHYFHISPDIDAIDFITPAFIFRLFHYWWHYALLILLADTLA